jgi:hypothetical protein
MKLSLAGLSVFIGIPTSRDFPPETVASLISTARLLIERGIPFDMEIIAGGSIIEAARTRVAHRFLMSDKNRLFWIDSDITWDAEDFVKILALSSELECVGCVYPVKQEPTKFFLNLDTDTDLASNDFQCFELNGLSGLGFACVQRKVMEQLAEKAPKLLFGDNPEPMPHIFRCDTSGKAFRGEDMAFFDDVRDLGYKVNLFPHVKLGHVGPKTYKADFMETLKAAGAVREVEETNGTS